MNNSTTMVEALRNGHEQTFTSIYRQYVSQLLLLANRFVRDNELADRCVADAFTALWKHKHTITDEGHIKGFLLTTTRNICINYLKAIARGTGREIATLPEAFDEEQAETLLMESAVMTRLRNLFRRLSPAQQVVAALAWIEGLSNEEIAQRLGKDVKHIRVVLSQIMTRLKSEIDRSLWSILLLLMAFYLWQQSFGLFTLVKNIFSFH